VINGEVIGGRQGIGGEWGHIHLDDSGGECYCGKTGCVERILAGPHLERYYHSVSGESKKLKEIVMLAREGKDVHAVATMDRLIHFFGKGLSKIINILDPDAIVLGGGVGNVDELYTRGKESLEKHVFNHKWIQKY
jgi:N-acetylglucosamine kinase (EC 2.7.1.59)